MKKVLLGMFLTAALVASAPYANADVADDLSDCSNASSEGLRALVNCGIGGLNAAMYVLMSLSVVYTVYGGFEMVTESKRESGRQRVIYGVIGLFAMISIWGFVNILSTTFGVGGEDPREAPRLGPL